MVMQLSDQTLGEFAVLMVAGVLVSVAAAIMVTDYRGFLTSYAHSCWRFYQRRWYQRLFLRTSWSRAYYADETRVRRFYGADDVETALTEVARADDREFFTVGKFVTTEPVMVVDLTRVPPVPSIFDPVLGGAEGSLRFLNDLVDELRQPIDTARSNLDYVPTQVSCEYFLPSLPPRRTPSPWAAPTPKSKSRARSAVWCGHQPQQPMATFAWRSMSLRKTAWT